MSGVKLASDTLKVTPAAGDIEYNGEFFGTDSAGSRGQFGRMRLEVAKTATGTAVDFTDAPPWAVRATVMFNGVSTSGTSPLHVRLGTSSGFESTGYANAISEFLAGTGSTFNITNAIAVENTTGNLNAAVTRRGLLALVNFSGNEWIYTSTVGSASNGLNFLTTGGKTLAALLTQIRITTLNGTDTFDAGTINILYEG